MTLEQLPRWDDCVAPVKAGRETALERFIYDQEPCGIFDERKFRTQLAAALSEVESAAVRRHLESEGPKPTRQTEAPDDRVAELEQRLDTMSRALAGVESMNRRLLELERMHGLTIARAH